MRKEEWYELLSLVKRIKNGDDDAYQEFISSKLSYKLIMQNFFYYQIPHLKIYFTMDEIEDIGQNFYIYCADHLEKKFKGFDENKSDIKTYCEMVLLSLWCDFKRCNLQKKIEERQFKEIEEELIPDPGDIQKDIEKEEMKRAILEAIEELSPLDRFIFLACSNATEFISKEDLEEVSKSYDKGKLIEIIADVPKVDRKKLARALNIPLNTLNQRYSRIRSRLRKRIEERLYGRQRI